LLRYVTMIIGRSRVSTVLEEALVQGPQRRDVAEA
jgi:hypothetical protein